MTVSDYDGPRNPTQSLPSLEQISATTDKAKLAEYGDAIFAWGEFVFDIYVLWAIKGRHGSTKYIGLLRDTIGDLRDRLSEQKRIVQQLESTASSATKDVDKVERKDGSGLRDGSE